MDEETSEGELLSFRVLEVGASKRKKKAFDWRVSEIFKSSTFASTLETLLDKGGPIDHFAPIAASSAKTTGGMEMELATK